MLAELVLEALLWLCLWDAVRVRLLMLDTELEVDFRPRRPALLFR